MPILILLFLLSSCGFQVIYKEKESSADLNYSYELAAIKIQKDRSRLGQKLKNNMYDTLNPDNITANPKYFLVLKVDEATSPAYITTTGASGRVTVSLKVEYTLKNLENAQTISSGSTTVNDNYDYSSKRYANYKAGVYVQTNLTKIVAQNIRNSLVNDMIELKRDCILKEKSKEKKSENCKLVEENEKNS